MDLESQKTLDEAIDRARGVLNEALDRVKAEIVAPLLAELAAWRAMAQRISLAPPKEDK
jgi:hypothetical protein